MSLDWPVDPFAIFDHYRSSLSPEGPTDEQQRGALPSGCMCHFPDGGLRCITWNTRGLAGSFFPSRRTENSNSNISRIFLTTTTSYVSRRCMEGTSISRLFRCWLHDLIFLGTFILVHSQGYSTRRGYWDTFDYLSRP